MKALRISSRRKVKSSDWLIDNIAEASKNARGIYLLYVGFLAYCVITVISTGDRKILLEEGVYLPIIGLDISFVGFFIAAPLVAIFVFIYLQLYLQRLLGLIKDFRDKNKSAPARRLYPWMINIAEEPEPGIIGKLQKAISNISLFGLLPLVLILFPLWFLQKHDPILTCLLGFFPLLGISIVLYFWRFFAYGSFKELFQKSKGSIILVFIVFVFEIFFYSYMIPKAFDGSARDGFWSPRLYLDVSYQKLINEQNEEYKSLYWINLQDANLQGANLTSSILKKADLRNANLINADLSYANLQGANLSYAKLQGANLIFAKLQGANLMEAKLQDAKLNYAKLNYAKLQGANLRYAKLQGADLLAARLDSADLLAAKLQGANFMDAKLQGANLSGAQLDSAYLMVAQLIKVRTLFKTILDTNLRLKIEEKYPHLLEEPMEE